MTHGGGGRRALMALAAVLTAIGGIATGQALWIEAKAIAAQALLAHAWARSVDGQREAKPWPWADTWPVARLQVPRLGRDVIVLADGGGESLAFGPAHVAASASPGRPGTTVIAAHRDTHFRFLRNLAPGDEIHLSPARGRRNTYRVIGADIVDAETTRIDPYEPDRLLLVTCYPFDALTPGGPLRYVVTAVRAAGPDKAQSIRYDFPHESAEAPMAAGK